MTCLAKTDVDKVRFEVEAYDEAMGRHLGR